MITKKVVIVDDFTGVRSIVKEALEKRGYQVLEASNGEEAMKYFNGTQIDLLITDYDMPDMDGAKLVGKLRDTMKYMYTPVIMLSGVRKERIEEKIAHLNIACFIQKPFDIKHFYTVVERLAKI
jgi:two-component system, chemotaxis family, chemotaxis protein CheY